MNASAFARQIKQLFPPGILWNFEAESWLSKFALAVADEFARVFQRGEDLINESDPTTADEMIEVWEESLGLPDEFVTEIPATLPERQLAVTAKLTTRGGQNDEFWINLAAACGYTVTVHNYGRAGELIRIGCRCTDLLYAPSVWGWAFRLDIEAPAGDALAESVFESVIRSRLHSHADVVFNYL